MRVFLFVCLFPDFVRVCTNRAKFVNRCAPIIFQYSISTTMGTKKGVPPSACSNVHPDGPFGPCAMCNKNQQCPILAYPVCTGFLNLLQEWPPILNLRSTYICDSDCICSTCWLKYSRKQQVQTDLYGSQLHSCVCWSTSASSYHHADFCKSEIESISGLPSNTVCSSEVSLCCLHYNK